MSLDFTLTRYEELCQALLQSGYVPMTIADYVEAGKLPAKLVIMRHDVDQTADTALKMARVESRLGVKATYYFRFKRRTFKPKIMKEISSLGHEVGYHYETLDKARGDYEKAMKIFERELSAFRESVQVKTISKHGNPLTRWDNVHLWQKHDFKALGVLGEAYMSLGEVLYLSDTGRTWGGEYKMKDWVPTKGDGQGQPRATPQLRTTAELIGLVRTGQHPALCLNTHAGRWADSPLGWAFSLMNDTAVNVVKRMLILWPSLKKERARRVEAVRQ
ncbi:MAG: hypothetical protein FJ020_05475 [Chloroflexi bacterium]|nr:hypothetical protein [Chloroflexota bacterium]